MHASPARPKMITLDATQVRVLAHPLRARLLSALREHGPATATVLASRFDSNSGTTSYHLRKLAEVGLVAEATDHGDGRDRWWCAASEGHSWTETEFMDDPDTAASADWLYRHHLSWTARAAEDWAEQRREWPRNWVAATDFSDFDLRLTPDGLRALVAELHEVIRRHRAEATATTTGVEQRTADRDSADPATAGVQKVIVVLQAFPRSGVGA